MDAPMSCNITLERDGNKVKVANLEEMEHAVVRVALKVGYTPHIVKDALSIRRTMAAQSYT